MELVHVWWYEITITWKKDGSIKEPNHRVHATFCFPQQHHSTTIIEVTEKNLVGQLPVKGDWILCKKEYLSAWVYIADCWSIALLGKQYYCIIHAWWNWLYKGIIHEAVKKLCSHWEDVLDIHVYIWPCAHQEQFAFGPECKELFPDAFIQEIDWKYTVDLVWFGVSQLLFHWIRKENIQTHQHCTIRNNNFYFSARCGEKERNFLWVTRKWES